MTAETSKRIKLDNNENNAVSTRDKNGTILSDKYIPLEVLLQFFTHVEAKTLLSCRLVCKHWSEQIQNYVWRKKAELTLKKKLDPDLTWINHYFISDRHPLNRNLVRNQSGERKFDYWIFESDDDKSDWRVERLQPKSLPGEGKNFCFIAPNHASSKYQIIDLLELGFSKYMLDNFPFIVKTYQWCYQKSNCAFVYTPNINFCGNLSNHALTIHVDDKLEIKDDIWCCVIKNYAICGPGLRLIKYFHNVKRADDNNRHGSSGCLLAGAHVELTIPCDLDNFTKLYDARFAMQNLYKEKIFQIVRMTEEVKYDDANVDDRV